MTQRIQAAFCMDSVFTDYAKIAAVSIYSAALNCSVPLDIHIVTVKEGRGEAQTIDDIRSMVGQHNARIILHEVDISSLGVSEERKKYIGTLLRLFLPEILAEDKVIYLDCDLAINLDLAELWDESLCGKSIAGAVDEGIGDIYSRSKMRSVIGSDKDYLNAGVLVMDLKKIRGEHSLFSESIDYLDACKKAVMRDQDALNHIFIGDKTVINRKYNRIASTVSSGEGFKDVIIHFTGKKPWKVIRSESGYQFWHYFLMMPWMTDPLECWRWTKDLVDIYTLPETLGAHGKIGAIAKIFIKTLKLKFNQELGRTK